MSAGVPPVPQMPMATLAGSALVLCVMLSGCSGEKAVIGNDADGIVIIHTTARSVADWTMTLRQLFSPAQTRRGGPIISADSDPAPIDWNEDTDEKQANLERSADPYRIQEANL